ncbi:MAG: type III polyketide synthase [Truepera sp.]|nr:type III polyketide synthase [Truepera sp.]MBS3967795.1 type III polyketide synthase [Truepera sp.]
MAVYVHHLETLLPETAYSQARAREVMSRLSEQRFTQRVIQQIYRHSAIDTRYSVIPDFQEGHPGGLFFEPRQGLRSPGTKARNDLYTEHARLIYPALAKKALVGSSFSPAEITHLVTVSCTGFYAPGPDYDIIKQLALRPGVERYHLGYMGCYAALPALRMAAAFCRADPAAVVLVVCLELCSLHLQLSEVPDALVAASVFADGAAAAVVSAREPEGPALKVTRWHSALTPVGAAAMTWTIGDQGFEMVLSSYVPDILEAHLEQAVTPLLEGAGVAREEVQHWAVHPGGRAILDKAQQGLRLSAEQLAPSREVLRRYGNMSSATILFVLREVVQQAQAGERVCAMAFGPGLTVESGLFQAV